MEYRHELKFFVSEADLELLRARISHLVKPDIHQPADGGYLITSLYFDNIYDRCLDESMQGCDRRHKYRLRIYEHSSDVIKLERKSKIHGMTAKKAVSVSPEECRELMQGRIPWLQPAFSEDKNRILCDMKLTGMQPKSIVQYNREAFVHPLGNVRITFDQNISGTNRVENFLDGNICTVPLLNTGVHILKVKYDSLLPKYISEALEIEKLMQTSFSKYVYSRMTIG